MELTRQDQQGKQTRLKRLLTLEVFKEFEGRSAVKQKPEGVRKEEERKDRVQHESKERPRQRLDTHKGREVSVGLTPTVGDTILRPGIRPRTFRPGLSLLL